VSPSPPSLWRGSRLLSFLSALLLFAAILAPPIQAATAREPLDRRLLRTIQIGAPQDITVAEIKRITENPNAKYIDNILARSALLVLQQDNPTLVPFDEVLGSVLNNLIRDSNAFPTLPALPDFRGKETVFTMVYAMVMSGNQERVTDVLEKHLLTGSKYKQAVVLSALRNVGTPRAVGLIQKYAEAGQESNLAQTAIADEDYPVLFEMHDRWNVVPPAERTRDNLRTIVQSGCDQRAAMAAYWLGFFAPSIDPNKEEADLQSLEAIVRKNGSSCEMMEHVIALKSLALRSRKSIDYWTRLARRTSNVWERHQIVVNAWARFGRKFAPAALDLLKTEPAQYIQWELLDGNLQTRQDYVYRDYWDIWIPVNILALMEFPEPESRTPKRGMDEPDLNTLFGWLESGARPKDPWVYNHMLYNLAGLVAGDDTLRLLRIFNAHPQRNQNYWIIADLQDPAAIPLIQYWSTLPAPKDQLEVLTVLMTNLDNRGRMHSFATRPCCEATEACLIDHLTRVEPASSAGIHSDEEARQWLARSKSAPIDFTIRYTDDLKRSAIVHRKSGPEEHWEFLYDCWRNTSKPPLAIPVPSGSTMPVSPSSSFF
jgi:hypothetical protein